MRNMQHRSTMNQGRAVRNPEISLTSEMVVTMYIKGART